MALFEGGLLEGGLGTGLLVGLGAVVLTPVILPVLRPLIVGAIKAGMTVYDEAAQAAGQARVAVVETAREGVSEGRRSAIVRP